MHVFSELSKIKAFQPPLSYQRCKAELDELQSLNGHAEYQMKKRMEDSTTTKHTC